MVGYCSTYVFGLCFIPQAGFTQCASEACGFLLSLPGLDTRVGKRLVEHLGKRISQSLESNPSLLSGNSGDNPHLPGGYASSPTEENIADMSQSSPAEVIRKESDRAPSLVPNNGIHPYPFPHFNSEKYSPDHHGETSGRKLSGIASSSEDMASKSIYKNTSSSSMHFPKLMCPQPTRTMPVGFSMSPEISLTIASRSSSMPMLPMSSASPSLSVVSTSSTVGECDRMVMSPGAMSDGGSSCQSEDMWRPW